MNPTYWILAAITVHAGVVATVTVTEAAGGRRQAAAQSVSIQKSKPFQNIVYKSKSGMAFCLTYVSPRDPCHSPTRLLKEEKKHYANSLRQKLLQV